MEFPLFHHMKVASMPTYLTLNNFVTTLSVYNASVEIGVEVDQKDQLE